MMMLKFVIHKMFIQGSILEPFADAQNTIQTNLGPSPKPLHWILFNIGACRTFLI